MVRRRIIGRAGVLAGLGLAAVLVACTPDGRDVTVALDGVPATLVVGDPVTAEATLGNAGTAAAVGAGLDISVPVGVAVEVDAPAGVTCGADAVLPAAPDLRVVQCTAGSLAPGAARVVALTLTGTAPGVSGAVVVNGSSTGRTDPEGGGAPNRREVPIAVVAATGVDLSVEAGPLDPPPPIGSASPSRTTVVNRGTAPAGPVTVTQTFPAGVALGPPTLARVGGGASGTCSVAGRIATCTTGAHAVAPLAGPGDAWEMVVPATPSTTGRIEVVHAATSALAEPVPDPTPNQATTAAWPGTAHLAIDLPAVVAVGSTFNVPVRWVGGGFGQYVQASIPSTLRLDALGAGLPFPLSCQGTGSVSCSGLGPFLSDGAAIDATFTALSVGGPSGVSMFINSEAGSASGGDRVEVVDPAITSDVHPAFTAPAFAIVDEPVTVTGEVRTAGPTPHDDVVATLTAPAGSVVQRATWGALDVPCAVAGRTVTCAVGDLAGHDQVPIEVTLTGHVRGSATLAVAVTSATAQDAPDPWPDTVAVTFPVRDDFVDLGLAATLSPTPPTQGMPHTTTWTVRNHGSVPSSGSVLTIAVPAGHSAYRTTGPSGGGVSCTIAGQEITCTVAALAGGATRSVEVLATTGPPGAGEYRGEVVGAEPEPPDGGASSAATVAVDARVPNADVEVTAGTPTAAAVGMQTSFTARVVSNGPSRPTPGITAVVTVPEGWRLDSAGAAGECTVSGSTATCSRAELGVFQIWSITVRITPLAVRTDSPVTVAVASTLVDLVPANDTATALASSFPAVVDLEVARDALRFPRGGWETRTVRATNHGPDRATNVVVTGTFGAGAHVQRVVDGAACTWTEQSFRCTRTSLLSGSSATFQIEVAYDAVPGPIPLDLQVSSSSTEVSPDPHPNTVPLLLVAHDAFVGVRGTVTRAGGVPVAGARVSLFAPTDTFAPTRRVDTAADGTFSAADLPYGTYRVQITPPAGSGLVLEWHQDTPSRTAATPLTVGPTTPEHQLSVVLGPTPTS